jgi:cobalt-zinc-cadmium efflux system membrane fusion protein
MKSQEKSPYRMSKLSLRLFSILFIGLLPLLIIGCGEESKNSPANNSTEKSIDFAGVEVHKTSDCPTKKSCFICDPKEREEGRLWCKEHHRYEDRCWLCHPELEEKGRLYCKEHGIYEDECYLCHPEVKSKPSNDQTSLSPPKQELFCKEHGVAEAECAICQPQLAADLKPGQSLKIRISSPEAIEKVGVKISKAATSPSIDSVKAYATVDYNRNQMVSITPLIDGVVIEVKVNPGQKVSKGEAIGLLHSIQLAEIKSSFLTALAELKLASLSYEREQKLSIKKISAKSDLETAEATLQVAKVKLASNRQHLINLGLTEKDIKTLTEEGRPTAQLTLKAPISGTVVERNVSVGELIELGDSILKVVDLSSMWLELSVPAREAATIKKGMQVSAHFDETPGVTIEGELIWIYSAVDPKTRRIQARALIKNPPHSIRKGLYGQAKIKLSDNTQAIVVPTDSIQEIDGIPFVFVRKEPSLFAATRIEFGKESQEGLTAIHQGLTLKDQIVTHGSYILRSEFLKSQLGAGCVDD